MDLVRLVLALALACYLSGVPAVVASPCFASADEAAGCCAGHQGNQRTTVIGHCDCESGAPAAERDAVTVAPTSPDRHDNPSLVALPFSLASVTWSAADIPNLLAVPFDTSPPRLSGTGFRC